LTDSVILSGAFFVFKNFFARGILQRSFSFA